MDPPAEAASQGRPPNRLNAFYVFCLQALGAFLDFEAHSGALFQGTITFAYNSRKVDEDVVTTFALNKPVALGSVEPLHGALFLHAEKILIFSEFAICEDGDDGE